MAAYRRVYDSRHLQADCQEPGSVLKPTLGNRVWATFTFLDLRGCKQFPPKVESQQPGVKKPANVSPGGKFVIKMNYEFYVTIWQHL